MRDPYTSPEEQGERIGALYRAAGASALQLEFDSFVAAEALSQTSESLGIYLATSEVRILHFYAKDEIANNQ